MVVYPTIYKVFHIPGGCLGFQPSTAGGYVGVSVRSKGRNIPLMPRETAVSKGSWWLLNR